MRVVRRSHWCPSVPSTTQSPTSSAAHGGARQVPSTSTAAKLSPVPTPAAAPVPRRPSLDSSPLGPPSRSERRAERLFFTVLDRHVTDGALGFALGEIG